jgi:hypothetical protein
MRSVALAGCFLVCVGLAFGQAGTGTITGVVTDQTGAVVAGANISAKNSDTGAVYPAASSNTGNYTLTQLPPGNYELDVKVQGFKDYIHKNLQVAAAGTIREDVPLQVGATGENVTVTAEASLLKTESGDLSSNITIQDLDSLPVLGIGNANSGSSGIRNPYNAVALLPGVNYSANSTMIINGAPTNTAAYRLDGMDNTNHTVSFAVQENQPSGDAIQEIAVQTSNYAPEFGAAGGGLINITMKSGTNAYHGSGYEYFVNEDLNAAQPFSTSGNGNKVRPRNRRNDYGGTLGGPIYIPHVYNGHNKSFFFFSFEEFRESSLLTPGQTLPINDYRLGNFSTISPNGGSAFNTGLGVTASALPSKDALGRSIFANTIYDPSTIATAPSGVQYANPFQNNIIPANRFDPVAVAIQKLIPPAVNSAYTNNGNYTNISQRQSDIPSVKGDHSIGTKSKVSFYWSTTGTDSLYSLPNGNADGLPPIITQARGTFIHSLVERLNFDHTVTPTLLVHFGAGYSRIRFFDDGPVKNFDCATIGLINCQGSVYFPRISIGTVGSVGGVQSFGNAQAHTHTNTERPSSNLNATWIKGSHTYKIGGEVWFQGQITAPPTGVALTYGANGGATALPFNPPQGLGSSTIGFGYANFLLGDVTSASQRAPNDTRMGQSQWAFFAQDSWKVTRKLTLDYGVRWDFAPYSKEQYGRSADLSPTLANPSAGGHPGAWIYEATCNCHFVQDYPYAIGPRLGFAYQVNNKTVIRGGWGLVYAPSQDIGSSTANTFTNQPAGPNAFFNIEDPTTLPKPVWPNLSAGIYPLVVAGAGTTNNALAALDQNINRPPRQNQWSIGIQREVTRDLVVEAAYVANRGVWWGGPLGYLNQVSPANYAAYGLYPYTNAADNVLLSSTVATPSVIQRVGTLTPYAGYPTSSTLKNTLTPYPQFATGGFGGFGVSGSPTGKTWYDSLQAKVTKRLSHGLQAQGAFTWSKALQFVREDFFNPNSSIEQLQGTDQPFLINGGVTYTTPKAEFLNRYKGANWVIKDWLATFSFVYGSGTLLTPPGTTTTNNLGTSQMVRVVGQPLYLKDLNCHCINPWTDQVLNPNAWTNPTSTGQPDYTLNNSGGSLTGVFGPSAMYGDFRGPRHPTENFNLGRNFRIKERMNLQIRAEFTNVFNRVFLGNPSAGGFGGASPRIAVGKNNLGQITSGFGTIPNATSAVGSYPTLAGNASLPRQGTLIARFTF